MIHEKSTPKGSSIHTDHQSPLIFAPGFSFFALSLCCSWTVFFPHLFCTGIHITHYIQTIPEDHQHTNTFFGGTKTNSPHKNRFQHREKNRHESVLLKNINSSILHWSTHHHEIWLTVRESKYIRRHIDTTSHEEKNKNNEMKEKKKKKNSKSLLNHQKILFSDDVVTYTNLIVVLKMWWRFVVVVPLFHLFFVCVCVYYSLFIVRIVNLFAQNQIIKSCGCSFVRSFYFFFFASRPLALPLFMQKNMKYKTQFYYFTMFMNRLWCGSSWVSDFRLITTLFGHLFKHV